MQLSVVSYLDKDTTAEVRKLQRTLSDITGSTASLLSWEPHVTIGDGVELDRDGADQLIRQMEKVANANRAFDLELSEFKSFDTRPIGRGESSTPYVIYIDVKVNKELLSLVKDIEGVTEQHSQWYRMHRPYTPHVTLAFRDLGKEGYDRGLAFLANQAIDLTTKIDHIALVEKLPDRDSELHRIALDI